MRHTPCSAQAGHYTAHCRPNDGNQWLAFDDSRVTPVTGDVITESAYVLFFRRFSDDPCTLANLKLNDGRCSENSAWLQGLAQSGADIEEGE